MLRKVILTVTLSIFPSYCFGDDCSFGKLCDKSAIAEIFSQRTCINDKCADAPGATRYINVYFSPDNYVMAQFGTWGQTPGMMTNTYVCRQAPAKTLSESCEGDACNRMDQFQLDAVKAENQCSFSITPTNIKIAFSRKVHQYSKKEYLSKSHIDSELSINLVVTPGKPDDPRTDCTFDVNATDNSVQSSGGPELKSSFTYQGTSSIHNEYRPCTTRSGIELSNYTRVGGRIIDAGPSVRKRDRYPDLKPNQTTYPILASDADGEPADELYIPDGVTLKPEPGITEIKWTFRKIYFGKNATIDLSASESKPGRAADAPPMVPPQADYCKIGFDGTVNGGNGKLGASGIPLTIKGIESVDAQGSLWIKTSGGPGGDGGAGQNGQIGGGHRPNLWGCDGAPGGAGANGGAGGSGGATSAVSLHFVTYDVPKHTENIDPKCDSDNTPDRLPGVITVYGSGGCKGAAGPGGRGGPGGENYAKGGPNGYGGPLGQDGTFGLVTFEGPH